MGLRGSIGGLPGGPRTSRGYPRDPMGPWGWFDESFLIHKAYMPVYK